MAKISPVSAKYIVHSVIDIEGIVDRPDVVGAIFGQTEGLLGTELELRELQRSGRIGRIEVTLETKGGKTHGTIIIPSSLDKAETCIMGAALEIIQRIGPCNSKLKVGKIEDVRISKRKYVVERAKELLKEFVDTSSPDSQELADEVAYSVRVMEIQEFGKDRLAAGPAIEESEEVIVVEGRADVVTLIKHGFKNVISMNGSGVPQTIIDLSKEKSIIVFVDGDRGGDLNIQELLEVAEIDFVTRAPDGKEVEELTKKELHKCLRSKIAAEQAKLDVVEKKASDSERLRKPFASRSARASPARASSTRTTTRTDSRSSDRRSAPRARPDDRERRPAPRQYAKKTLKADETEKIKGIAEELVGTRGAYILDQSLNILGKVPTSELESTVSSLSSGVYAVVFDGSVESSLVQASQKIGVKHLIAMDSKVDPKATSINIVKIDKL
ncbi:DNA primase [Candidatus Woesearchaeota archaeon]|mgnify:FL=1|jgi:DNA primase|nr:DNA primase [Candidatus Woesearchaeota archaeon]MBT3537415.1 DNA primase [Candidatus Woesearchaeota archaeon]MBT4697784.1 DNA primase [Candidatus Woesearchaeota archaeon]MBT4717529.1 DNA primase [Candidatus Woesearchaeota archaeon]MBT7106275.1 DNA primase [Candidatus Woesearchaeota archaeon]